MKTTTIRSSVCALAVVCFSMAVGHVRAEIIEQILLKVNGEIFTKSELETRQVAALRALGQPIDPKANLSDETLRKMLADVTPRLMVDVVDEMLMVQRGRELTYKMTDEQFQSILDNLKKDNKLTTDEEFQAALKQENMTMVDLRKNLERQWVVSRVQQNEVFGRIGVTEDEARKYYDAHRGEFTTGSSVTLREILIAVPKDASVTADASLKQKAADIRKRALGGESFETLASELSEAPSRANAGLVGPLSLDEVSADLKQILGRMKPGDISDPLRAVNGYELFKLESATTAETRPFEEARNDISNRVFTDKRKNEFEKYLTKLRSEAIIEWKNADLKKAFDLGLEQQKAGGTGPAQ